MQGMIKAGRLTQKRRGQIPISIITIIITYIFIINYINIFIIIYIIS